MPELDQLDRHPDAARIRSRRMQGKVATLIVDATGLDEPGQRALEQSLRDAALIIPGVEEARIALTAAKRGRILVAIGSGKGGVGKSTLAANLAVALARMGKKVGLVDADIYGPSQPRLMGATARAEARNKQLIPLEAHGVKLLSVGGAQPADRGRLGRCRAAHRRPAARYRRCAIVVDPEGAPSRGDHRLDAAGPVADRRGAGRRPVREDPCPGRRDHREHGRL
jgi:hypothetical protein